MYQPIKVEGHSLARSHGRPVPARGVIAAEAWVWPTLRTRPTQQANGQH
jgi:hypothetical protein